MLCLRQNGIWQDIDKVRFGAETMQLCSAYYPVHRLSLSPFTQIPKGERKSPAFPSFHALTSMGTVCIIIPVDRGAALISTRSPQADAPGRGKGSPPKGPAGVSAWRLGRGRTSLGLPFRRWSAIMVNADPRPFSRLFCHGSLDSWFFYGPGPPGPQNKNFWKEGTK